MHRRFLDQFVSNRVFLHSTQEASGIRDINRQKDVCAYLMKKSTTLSAAWEMMGLAQY